MTRNSLIACCVIFPILAMAQAPTCQTELNGFLLGQYTSALDYLGEPMRTGNQNGWSYQAYQISENGYVVFEVDPEQPDKIAAIQITGDVKMRPFAGIRLGDTEAQLVLKLGKPDRVTDDKEWGTRLFVYQNRNYTIEIKSGLIYSIRIIGYHGCAETPALALTPEGKPLLEELRKAVVNRDANALVEIFAGDVELYKGNEVLTFKQAALVELVSGDTDFTRSLFGPSSSLRAVLEKDDSPTDEILRFYEKGGLAHVIKFAANSAIDEIVYRFDGGRWKVWEVRFRTTSDLLPQNRLAASYFRNRAAFPDSLA